MKIIDLSDKHKSLFCLCLEDWPDEAKEAGPKLGVGKSDEVFVDGKSVPKDLLPSYEKIRGMIEKRVARI